MRLNPETLRWRAPTLNEDGSPIDYELAYELELDGTAVAVFPGRLNPDGVYEQDVDGIFPNITNASYIVTLRAFRVDQPTLKSAPSNAVTHVFDRRVPRAPLLLDS